MKNGEERLVVLNRVARSVIESVRGMHPEYVFVHETKGELKPVGKMQELKGTPAPQGFRRVRVHDLKHTWGRRLRAAGVSFEDRQDLLGHKSGRITTHYSQAELASLIAAAEKVCGTDSHKIPAITWLRRQKA